MVLLLTHRSPIFAVSILNILWENRLEGDTQDMCLVTVDGTHFRVYNKTLPNSWRYNTKWFSHKYRAAAVSYEVAVSIKTGDIVWICGPFPGATPDINIFRYKLKQLLLPFERVMADRGYQGDRSCRTPYNAMNCQHARAMAVLRSRQETVNRRFKIFGALKQIFRHSVDKHHAFFRTSVVLTQLAHQRGYSHYDAVGYVDPAFEADW